MWGHAKKISAEELFLLRENAEFLFGEISREAKWHGLDIFFSLKFNELQSVPFIIPRARHPCFPDKTKIGVLVGE